MVDCDHKPKFKIFSLNSNLPLAKKVAEHLGVTLGKISVDRFSDGEVQVNIDESIRGEQVFIIQSTSAPVNDNLMELLITIDAIRRASASVINVVIPYYGYARQDRKARSREPITAKLVANMLETAGADRILALDLHATQIQGFFDIPLDNLVGAPLIANYFIQSGITENLVVVSPDHGGVTRARKLAEFLHAPLAIIDKRRPKANVAEVMNIIGEVKGKQCVMIDDIIDTAGTITLGAKALKEAGALGVFASCTHAVLSGPAMKRIDDSPIQKLIVTNSINLSDKSYSAKIKEISIAPLLSDAIKCIKDERPISPLFNYGFNEA